jgi:hypothetical protein
VKDVIPKKGHAEKGHRNANIKARKVVSYLCSHSIMVTTREARPARRQDAPAESKTKSNLKTQNEQSKASRL